MTPACPTEWGASIIDELCRQGVRHFCICPGSRSTALALAAGRRRDVRTHVFVDERSAAFFAMGIGKSSRWPAVLITTSGTAMANAYPAVLEAEASGCPLILLSADRPPELRKSGANQTIDQAKLFGEHVRFFFDLPCPTSGMAHGRLRGIVAQAHSASIHPMPGPVHLNAMFRKPLDSGIQPTPGQNKEPWVRSSIPRILPAAEDLEELLQLIRSSRRGFVALGAMDCGQERAAAAGLAERLGWPVLADAASGLRLHPFGGGIAPGDFLFRDPVFLERLSPDFVLHIGGPLICKSYGGWMEEQEVQHVSVQRGPFRYGPGNSSTWRLQCTAEGLLEALDGADLDGGAQCLERRDWFTRLRSLCEERIGGLLGSGFSEGGILRALVESLDGQGLFLSNSMPVRDFNRYAQTLPEPVPTGCSRGASGIDGIVSTAAGWALGQSRPAVALVGDLAAWHDLGAVLQLSAMDVPLLLVVVNNGGGAIFSHLPSPGKDSLFDRLFTARHGHRFAPIFQAAGVPCGQPNDLGEFRQALRTMLPGKGLRAIELLTDPEEGPRLAASVSQEISSIVGELG
jgi:2-succinyl-5-enolpyruvyl-6-hydroxy-3-cyclohexene-1-carboxylate synthase